MSDIAIKVENLKKQYKLGAIGGQTLSAELQSWWARKRGKEDPNLKIGQDYSRMGEIFWALNGINFEVKKGEALGVIGANGAGKSTLLKILSRVTAPTEGDVWIDGRVTSMLEVGTGFHGELTGRENIYMNGAILGMTRKEVDSKIESIIDFSECRQFIDTPVKRYSSGMYVKLAFAVASHLDSEIMVMDEVLAVGDMKFQKKCLSKMGDSATTEGKTILYVSHNMNTIRTLCDRCIVLNHGEKVYDGDVEKAIEIYLKGVDSGLPVYVDLRDAKRGGIERTQSIYIQYLKFYSEDKATFAKGRPLEFGLGVQIKETISNVRIGMRIKSAEDIRIGTTWSEGILCGEEGEETEWKFLLDVDNLVEGKYCFQIFLFRTNEYGTNQDYDKPLENIFFEVTDSGNAKVMWRPNFGSVKFNEIQCLL